MKIATKRITPTIAKEMLTMSRGNRALRQTKINQFVRAMRSGNWAMTGDAIRFDRNGTLIDGHHRLEAIVKAKTVIDTLVISGLSPDVIAKLDTGTARSAGDMLSFVDSQPNRNERAAAVRAIESLKTGRTGGATTLSNDEVYDRLQVIPERFDLLLTHAIQARRVCPTAPLVAVLFCGTHNPEYMEDASAFVDGLKTGENLCRGDARLALRTWLLANKVQKRTIRGEGRLAAIANAWNAYTENRSLNVIRWRARPVTLNGANGELYKAAS
ncbi:MAG: hypothetical protein MJH10_10435 [Epibacterium sp.]|nr:hypothetical protein [Epibacterium sp.]NQX73957.1 hypothetical protein [Epibacterium sp.]